MLPPGSLVVDSSTIAIDDAQGPARTGRGAPASASSTHRSPAGCRGPPRARSPSWSVARPPTWRQARPVLDVMAGRIFHVGGAGSGQAAKIANNLMLGITLAATCEGAVLADRLGLDHEVFYEMVKVSSGDSWTFRTWYPMPGVVDSAGVNRDFDGGFAINLMLKDIRLALAAGETTGTPLDFGSPCRAPARRTAGGRVSATRTPRSSSGRSTAPQIPRSSGSLGVPAQRRRQGRPQRVQHRCTRPPAAGDRRRRFISGRRTNDLAVAGVQLRRSRPIRFRPLNSSTSSWSAPGSPG